MKDISLKNLLEAGCHFGHKVEKWHPKAASFIYQARDGLHIIDLAKSRQGLIKAGEFIRKLAQEGKNILFVATKRQAKGVVAEAAKKAGIPFLTTRWIGGFVTNWEQVEKNIAKFNRMKKEKTDGSWSKFPKHEQIQLEKILRKIESVYTGVADLSSLPDSIFIVDIKKEIACLREAIKQEITTVAIVDSNADPNLVDYPIPANDDAVGSIKFIANYLADAYIEGRKIVEKKALRQTQGKEDKSEKIKDKKETEEIKKEDKKEEMKEEKVTEEKPKKRGRPKKNIP
jgi:small subunit ribosomal protein S2